MSSDPYRSDNAPFGEGPSGPEGVGPESASPPPADRGRARERVQLPATFLLVTGIVNLLWALYQLGGGIYTALQPADVIFQQNQQAQEAAQELLQRLFPGAQMQAAGAQSPEDMKRLSLTLQFSVGTLALVATLLMLLGGVSMLRLRGYALGILGSLAAAFPCISCLGCCGVGQAIGLWALVVLMNEEVRSTFP